MLLLLGCLFLPTEQANAIILDYVTNPGDDESVYVEYHWYIRGGERYYYSYPNAPNLQAGTKRDGNNYERNYLAFFKTNYTNIPSNAIIEKATLTLYFYEAHLYNHNVEKVGSGTFEIEPVDVPWDATTMTWGNCPSGLEEYKITETLNLTNSHKSIDITNIFRKWHDGSLANNGFVINGVSPKWNRESWASFASPSNGVLQNRPKLTIEYYMPPTNINVTPNYSKNTTVISWQSNGNSSGTVYEVWRDSTLLGTTTSLSYEDTTALNPTSKYTYKVRVKTPSGKYTSFITKDYKIPPSQPAKPSLSQSGGLGWKTSYGRGYAIVNWQPVTGAIGYKLWVYDGYEYRAFDVGNKTTWDSRQERIFPDIDWLVSQGDNTITTDPFNKVKGGEDLLDNPNILYRKTAGTSYDTRSNYAVRVSAYNEYTESCMSEALTFTLPNQTDTSKPTGEVKIQNGASAVNSTNVTLNLSASDTGSGVGKMRFSNDNIVWSAWETYKTTKTWTLTSGSGTKTVYVQFMDNAGNISLTYADDIILDVTSPTGSININNGATYATSRNLSLTLSASDNIQVSKMSFKVDNGAWQTPVAYTSPYTLTISPGDGTRTVYVKFIDSAGNESGAYSDTIILDESIPVISNFTINNNAEWAGAGGLTLNIDATDNGTGISEMQFSNDNATWSSWQTFAGIKEGWQPTPGNGVKTVYVRIRDKAGNISSVVSASIKVDTVKPTGSVVINDEDVKVGTINVKVKVIASDDYSGVDKISLSKDGQTWGEWMDYVPDQVYDFQLEGGVGNKYCYLRVRDKAGNISDIVRDDIYLIDDTAGPHVTLTINNGAEYTLDRNVKLTINAFDDLTPIENLQMRFSADGISWTPWERLAFVKDWTLSEEEGMQRVFMQVRDDSGNVATTGASISYFSDIDDFMNRYRSQEVDTEPPVITSFRTANGATIITGNTIPLSIIAKDNDPNLQMCFSKDGDNWTAYVPYKNLYKLNMSLSSGYRTIYVKIKDTAGNEAVADLSFFVK